MPCLCCPDVPPPPNLNDPLLIYHAPISIKYDNSYISHNNHILYKRVQFNYNFESTDYVNSRTFVVNNYHHPHHHHSNNDGGDGDGGSNNDGVENKITLKANEKKFILKEYHFHDHQENVINNDHQGVMEMHFVFQELNQNNYSVIGFIFKLSKHSSRIIRKIKKNQPIKIPKVKNYYTYSGSLTKPNIADIPQLAVNWNLSDRYLKISQKDLDYFRTNLCRYSSVLQNTNGRNTIYVN